MSHMPIRILPFGFALIVAGCGDSIVDMKEKEVIQGVARVKSLVNSTARNPMAALSLASMAESGGSIITYVVASLPDNETFTCYIDSPRPQPYCVTIRGGAAPGEYIIEGYGASTNKPLASGKAQVSLPKQR